MSEKKKILFKCPSYADQVRSLLPKNLYEAYDFEDYEELDERPSIDYTFLETIEDLEFAHGKVILLSAPRDYQKCFESMVEAVVWPKMLEHEVGQTLLKRLLGENSSLGMEAVYSRSDVDFKSFRFMDHLSMGHYSDILAQSADQGGFTPLNIRTYFDTISGFLGTLNEKVLLPYDVDFGVWKDVFVIQLHASCQDLYRSDFLKSMSDYSLVNPEFGLLKQAMSQVDALDIFTLERSERVVLTAQWFHPEFKAGAQGYPSVFIHEVPLFEELKPSFGHNTLKSPEKSSWSKKGDSKEAYEQVIQNIQGMDFSEFYEKVHGGAEEEDLDIEKVKALLGVTDEDILVRGKVEEDESFSRVKGSPEDLTEESQKVSGGESDETEERTRVKGQREDLTEESQKVSGGDADETEESTIVKGEKETYGDKAKEKFTISGEELKNKAEELWRIKQDEIIDNLKEKQVVTDEKKRNNLLPDEEVSEVVKNHLGLKDEEVDFVVKDLLTGEASEKKEKQQVSSLESQLKEQEIIKRDAQIDKMRKLIDRMKKELMEKSNRGKEDQDQQREARQEERDEQTKDRKIESLTKELERQKAAQRQIRDSLQSQVNAKEERLEKLTEENEELRQEKQQAQQEQNNEELEELKQANETLRNQVEVSRKRISQMSERMLNETRGSKEKEKSEVERLKELGAQAQKKIAQMQTDLTRAQKQLSEKESENIELAKLVENLEKVDGPKAEDVDAKHLNDEVEGLKTKNKQALEREKKLGLDLKKLEQKNRFLQAQLDSAQKKNGASQGGSSGAGAQGADKKVKQYERVIEVMKDNEARVQEDLLEKKDQVQKLKAEGMVLKNKISELERKLQKYEKSAA